MNVSKLIPQRLLLLLLLFLSTAAPAQQSSTAQQKPALHIWTIKCHNEQLFWNDYNNDALFQGHLNRYVSIEEIPIRKHCIDAILLGIRFGPTFAMRNQPLVVGYRGKSQLLKELGLPPLNTHATPEIEAQPQEVDLEELRDGIKEDVEDQIGQVKDRIGQSETAQHHRLQDLKSKLDGVASQADLSEVRRSLFEIAQLIHQQGQATEPVRGPPAVSPETTMSAAAKPSGRTTASQRDQPARGGFWGKGRRFAGFAFSAAQLAMLVGGGTLATGGTATAVYTGLKLFRAIRKKGSGIAQQRVMPLNPTTQKSTETVFRTVSTDNGEGEAYREAIRRIGGLHPDVVPILNQLEAAQQQIFHGHTVAERNKKHHESRPGMWNDPTAQ